MTKYLCKSQAGNILIGSRGAIKLGDLGVSACLFDSGDRQRMRNTFVGTPCWYIYFNKCILLTIHLHQNENRGLLIL